MEELLEPFELLAVREDDASDERSLRRPEPGCELGANLGVARDQLVDDVVARADGGAGP